MVKEQKQSYSGASSFIGEDPISTCPSDINRKENARGGGHSLSLSLLPLNIFITPFQKSPNYRSNFSLQLVRVGVSTFPTDIKNTGLIQHAEVELTNLCRLHTAHNAQS